MPFDVLPQHHIEFPRVQFWHPPWEMYQSMIESKRLQYAAMLQGLDKVLNAADPMAIAQRRLSIAKAESERQYGLPAQEAEEQAKIKWYAAHPDVPWSGGWRDLAAYQRFKANQPVPVPAYGAGKTQTGDGQPQPSETLPPSEAPSAGAADIYEQQRKALFNLIGVPSGQTDSTTPPLLRAPQTISGGNVTDDQGNLLPPEQQGQKLSSVAAPDYLDTHPLDYYGQGGTEAV